jgi:hypothetical protein
MNIKYNFGGADPAYATYRLLNHSIFKNALRLTDVFFLF